MDKIHYIDMDRRITGNPKEAREWFKKLKLSHMKWILLRNRYQLVPLFVTLKGI